MYYYLLYNSSYLNESKKNNKKENIPNILVYGTILYAITHMLLNNRNIRYYWLIFSIDFGTVSTLYFNEFNGSMININNDKKRKK